MPPSSLLSVYGYLFAGIGLGWLLERGLARRGGPMGGPPGQPSGGVAAALGQFLFWVGVPISVVGFLRGNPLSASVWLAPAIAWVAILSGLSLAGLVLFLMARLAPSLSGTDRAAVNANAALPGRQRQRQWYPLQPLNQRRTQGSFLLTAMVGNTGYIGFPVALALVGPAYFVWALVYDMLGSLLGSYGLGVVLASQFGTVRSQRWRPSRAIALNPTLWSFGVGLLLRSVPLPGPVDVGLKAIAWTMMALSLVLVGMRLGQLKAFKGVGVAIVAVTIKMLIVPLILGTMLWHCGITGPIHRAILLQVAMPPAFATLVISEAYSLDPELAVTALVMGCVALLLLLPLWMTLFPI